MKDFRGMKRQRSRNRKPSGQSNNPNRAYESNGPDGAKVRGNAQTIYEKYQQLARDANSSGDRVLAENHLQHAEHYFRLIRLTQPQRPVAEYVQRDPFMNGFDFDFEDESDQDSGDLAEAASVEENGYSDEPRSESRPEREPRYEGQDRPERSSERQRDSHYDRNGNDGQNRDRNNRDRNNRDRNGRDKNRDRMPDRNQDRPQERAGQDRVSQDRGPQDRFARDNRDNSPEPIEYDAEGNRRETRRERYERRRQQRLMDQEAVLNSFEPMGHEPVVAMAQPIAVIASTEPLAAPRRPERIERPERQERQERPVAEELRPSAAPSEDVSHLPAFLRAKPVRSEAVEASTSQADEAELKVPAKRGRPKRVKPTEDISSGEEV